MSRKSHKSVRITNPKATTPGLPTSTAPAKFAPLPGPEPITPVTTPRSRRLLPGPSVRITGKAPNPHVSDVPEGS
jgi:hypothetical protein